MDNAAQFGRFPNRPYYARVHGYHDTRLIALPHINGVTPGLAAELETQLLRHAGNVLFYEGPTTVNFTPTVFIDIADEIKRKIQALQTHRSQVMKTRIEGTEICEIAEASAHFRGVQGRVRWAEGFSPLRLFINVTGAPAVPGPPARGKGGR